MVHHDMCFNSSCYIDFIQKFKDAFDHGCLEKLFNLVKYTYENMNLELSIHSQTSRRNAVVWFPFSISLLNCFSKTFWSEEHHLKS